MAHTYQTDNFKLYAIERDADPVYPTVTLQGPPAWPGAALDYAVGQAVEVGNPTQLTQALRVEPILHSASHLVWHGIYHDPSEPTFSVVVHNRLTPSNQGFLLADAADPRHSRAVVLLAP